MAWLRTRCSQTTQSNQSKCSEKGHLVIVTTLILSKDNQYTVIILLFTESMCRFSNINLFGRSEHQEEDFRDEFHC